MIRTTAVAVSLLLLLAIDGGSALSLTALAQDLCRREPEREYCRAIVAEQNPPVVKTEVRRAPLDFAALAAAASGGAGKSPLAFGRSIGNNADFEVPGLGVLGVGQSAADIAKFIPQGTANNEANEGTFKIGDSSYGYTQEETGTGQTKERHGHVSIAGIGTFDVGKKFENGAGISKFLDGLIPKMPDPPGGIQNPSPPETNTDAEVIQNHYYSNAYSGSADKYRDMIAQFEKKSKKALAAGAKTKAGDTDSDEDEEFEKDGFLEQKGFEEEKLTPQVLTANQAAVSENVPLSELGLKKEQIFALCHRFSVIAAQVCYGSKVQSQYLDKCRGYFADCADYIAEAKPLGAVANAFSSSVGLTYYNVGVNGIPYYAVNEEGGISNGHNGKVDFGSYGGGYSDTAGVRDFWTQNGEWGGNWYEGLYGYKTGWKVPIAEQLGIEGGGGTHISIPVKEGSLGQPIQVSNGYHVGPYVGMAESLGVDWYNGGVSASRGFALPIVGVNANAGTSFGFPSVSTLMKNMGFGSTVSAAEAAGIKG